MLLNASFIFIILIKFNKLNAQMEAKYFEDYNHQLVGDWFNEVTNPKTYWKWKKPPTPLNAATIVNVSLHLYTLAFLDDQTTEFSAQLLLRAQWIDERLICPSKICNYSDAEEITEGNDYYLERVWSPMIHVPNNHETFPITDTRHYLFKVHPRTGLVLTSKRIKIRVYCSMNLVNYPYDYQSCVIKFESSALPIQKLVLKWAENPVFITDSFKLFGYDLVNISTVEGYSSFYETGNFSCVIVNFTIARKFGQFFLDTYVPTILFVLTSFIGFYIEIASAPARVSLGMTTLLTLVTSAKSSREKIPKMSYINALDIWILTCICFVFSTIIEYACVNYIYWKDKRCKKRRAMRKCASTASFMSLINPDQYNLKRSNSLMPDIKFDSNPYTKEHSKTANGNLFELRPPHRSKPLFTITDDCDSTNQNTLMNGTIPHHHQSQISRSTSLQIDNCNSLFACDSLVCTQDIANSIDRRCRIIFPTAFLIFNVVYWSVLLLINW